MKKKELVTYSVSGLQSIRNVGNTIIAFSRTNGGWLQVYSKSDRKLLLIQTLYDAYFCHSRPLPRPEYFGMRSTEKRKYFLIHCPKANQIDTGWQYIRIRGENKYLDLRTRRNVQREVESNQLLLPFIKEEKEWEKFEIPTYKPLAYIENIKKKYTESNITYLKDTAKKFILDTVSNEQIFISYSHEDRKIAFDLKDKLKSNRFSVWIDQIKLEGGNLFWREICGAIDSASVGIILLSKNSVKSEYVQHESYQMLFKHRKDPNFLLIPVLIDIDSFPSFMMDLVRMSVKIN